MITSFDFPLEDLREDKVWSEHIERLLQEQVPENVFGMWNYCFTEILNNAIDHSEGNSVKIMVSIDSSDVILSISDDGVGIFHKIQSAFGLDNPREAILELVKGKLTTDPTRHTGEESSSPHDAVTHLTSKPVGCFLTGQEKKTGWFEQPISKQSLPMQPCSGMPSSS